MTCPLFPISVNVTNIQTVAQAKNLKAFYCSFLFLISLQPTHQKVFFTPIPKLNLTRPISIYFLGPPIQLQSSFFRSPACHFPSISTLICSRVESRLDCMVWHIQPWEMGLLQTHPVLSPLSFQTCFHCTHSSHHRESMTKGLSTVFLLPHPKRILPSQFTGTPSCPLPHCLSDSSFMILSLTLPLSCFQTLHMCLL